MGLLIFLMIGLALELLSAIRTKTRDLKAKSRARQVVYAAIPLVIAATLFFWIFSRFGH